MREKDSDARNFRKCIRLTLRTGEEHNLYINSNIHDASELMYPAFQAALVSLREILYNSRKWSRENQTAFQMGQSAFRLPRIYEYSNNILAFCAARGQGKTSAMLSFAEALRTRNWAEQKDSQLEGVYFHVLPPIDPTLLEKNDSVVEIVLSRIYQEFDSHLQQSGDSGFTLLPAEKGKLLVAFQQCVYGLKTAGRRDSLADDFEALTQLSDCFRVKELLQEILTSFFQALHKDPASCYLVIPLDDTDLQFQYAYKTLEEVRKYLSLPNVIILMATDLDQLRKLIIDHHLTVLEHAVEKNIISLAEIQRMTAKYLDKLIPASHAIYLPAVDVQYEAAKEIWLDSGEELTEESKRNPRVELQTRLLELICQKTGIIFAQPDGKMHPLIPTTLRGLRQFYRFLSQMEDCSEPGGLPYHAPETEEKRIACRNDFCNQVLEWSARRERNLNLLENYLVNDWCSSKLSSDDWKLVTRLRQQNPLSAISLAAEWIRENYARETTGTRGIKGTKGVGYMYLVNLLEQLNDNASALETRYFVCAIRVYFSIQFHKLALRGWRDSIYKWEDTQNPTRPISFRFPELCVCIGQQLTMVRGGCLEIKLSRDLINCLPQMLVAGIEDMSWQQESVMIRVLNFVLAVCCNCDMQAQAREYANTISFDIPEQTTYQNAVQKYYMDLDKSFHDYYPLPETASLKELIPNDALSSIFQTDSLNELKENLKGRRIEDLTSTLEGLADTLEIFHKEEKTTVLAEAIFQKLQSVENDVAILKADISRKTAANLRDLLAGVNQLIAGELDETKKNSIIAKLREAAKQLEAPQEGNDNGADG